MPIYRDERTYSFTTNVTKVKGAHEFRGGYGVNFLYLDHWQPEADNPRGRFDFTTRNVTALRGGAQTNNRYNQFASFLLGLPGTVSKSVQAELMTGREWQHGLFIRDRWTVSSKLTLDLGLRWEYYPIMQPRGPRRIERLDLQTLDVLLGGDGGNPKDVGIEAGKDNFAPRLGVVYRMNEETVFRTGYGVTYNPMPWSRPLRGSLPADDRVAVLQQRHVPAPTAGSSRAFRRSPCRPEGTGRVQLDRAAFMRTPEPGNIDRGTIKSWNLAVERRLPMDFSVDLAYVGANGDGGYADLDINAPQAIGAGDAGRPYCSMGRSIAHQQLGPAAASRGITRCRSGFNRPFTKGLLLKGAYTLGQVDEHGRRGRLDGRHLQHAQPDRPQLRARRLRPEAQLPARVRLSAAVENGRGRAAASLKALLRRLAGERRVRRVQRHCRSR